MKAIITAFIFPMQKRNHKAAMNLFPQGHTASTVVEKKTATAVLLSFVPSYQGSLLPNNSTFAREIIWNGILSSEGKTTWLINHRDQSMKIFVRPDPSACKCMMLEVKGDGWWNDKCQCLSNAVKPRSKEMLWLVVRLMAHDLPWKFFSERYWSCLIKRAILVPTSASTCTDTKGEVPCKPMRDAAQLVASEPFHWSVIWAPQLGQATPWATAAPRTNSAPPDAGSSSFMALKDGNRTPPVFSDTGNLSQMKLGFSEPPDFLSKAKDKEVCKKSMMVKEKEGKNS